MQTQLNNLLERHCETIKSSVTALGSQLAEIAKGSAPDPLGAVQSAEALAHQLKGSSGTAGFHEISRAATALDDRLKLLCKANRREVADGANAAMGLFDQLERISGTLSPASSVLYRAA